MRRLTRRDYVKGLAAGAASAPALAASPLGRLERPPRGTAGIKLALMMNAKPDHKTRLGKQIGVDHAIVGVLGALAATTRDRYEEVLAGIVADYKAAGMAISGVESHPVPAEKIKLGIDGRDEEIENYIAAVRALSNVGIPVLCYNFMAGIGWYRTSVKLPGRGGSLVTEFDLAAAKAEGLTKWGEVPEEKIWANLEYFQKAVIPVAEKAGIKMALHPDDPPLSPLRGIGRILTSAANYRRVMKIVPSPVNGITFCQANFVAMGEDIEALAKEWCREKKIFFVHFRDIAGTRQHFRETFHDNGPTDMGRMLQVYHDNGFDGPIRPDHAPTLDGEANDKPGYALQGKIFAIGYMKGLMEGRGIPFA